MKYAAVLLLVALVAPRVEGPCDLAKAEAAHWCEACEEVRTAAELVSSKVYFECPDCGDVAKAAGHCAECDVDREKKTSPKDACATCMAATSACQACVKEYFTCPGCEAESHKAGKCPDCEETLRKQISRARIVYDCANCLMTSPTAGKCTDEDCDTHGTPLTRTCTASGTFPHETAAK